MRNKILSLVVISAFIQLASVSKSFGQTSAMILDIDVKEEFAVLYLKMKNEFQVTDAKLQLGSSRRAQVDTMEKRLRGIDNQPDILNYMSQQGWALHQSQFSLNGQGNLYPFAYMVHTYRRQKR